MKTLPATLLEPKKKPKKAKAIYIEGFEITKNTTIPIRRSWVDLLRQLDDGDSTIISKKHYPSLHKAGRRLGIKVICRKIDDEQCRVWFEKAL
jgi:hypothetical protein